MEIIELNDNTINQIEDKVFCWGMVNNYLGKLFQEYSISNKVIAVIDKNGRISGNRKIENVEVMVTLPKILLNYVEEKISIIITCDYYKEIIEEIKSMCISCEWKIFYYMTSQAKKEMKYRKKYENHELENIIVFRSGPTRSQYIEGTDFYDNSRALFEYMVENGYNEKYELIWLVKEPDKFKNYSSIKNVKFLSFDWEDSDNEQELDEYYRALCLAKYLFTTDAYGFARNFRKDQKRIQLWHGCGFKTRTNFNRCENRYDYTTVVSDLYKEIHKDIYGLREEQVLVTGYAKHDWLFKPYEKDLSLLLDTKKSSKYIFWLPTFRVADDKLGNLTEYEINPDTGLPIVINYEQMQMLNDLLFKLDITLIIKLHPFQKNLLVKDYEFSNIAVIKNSDISDKDLIINRLLASADAFISDYSSAAVDFLNADKPIAFTLDDVEEYKNSRGFVFDNIQEWLPGKEVWNFDDFCEFIKEIAEGKDTSKEKREKVAKKMLKYRDNNNCKRIVETLNI